MSKLLRFMSRKNRHNNNNGQPSPDQRQQEFLRDHEARMRRVDEAVAEVKRNANSASASRTEKPAV
jgi:hypothetical protein